MNKKEDIERECIFSCSYRMFLIVGPLACLVVHLSLCPSFSSVWCPIELGKYRGHFLYDGMYGVDGVI